MTFTCSKKAFEKCKLLICFVLKCYLKRLRLLSVVRCHHSSFLATSLIEKRWFSCGLSRNFSLFLSVLSGAKQLRFYVNPPESGFKARMRKKIPYKIRNLFSKTTAWNQRANYVPLSTAGQRSADSSRAITYTVSLRFPPPRTKLSYQRDATAG